MIPHARHHQFELLMKLRHVSLREVPQPVEYRRTRTALRIGLLPMRLPLTRISVVLPVYNEASTVGVIIEKVLALDLPDIDIELIVVESNSTDGSREIVQRYAGRPGVKLILQDAPRGKGAAVREGFEHATGDIVLIQDGDLEYRVEEYPVVLAPLLAGDVNFVLGCRHARGRPMRVFPEARLKSRVRKA